MKPASHIHSVHRIHRWLAALLCVATLGLSGCAGLRTINTDVSNFGTWPAGRAPGTYAFERLPSQQSNPAEQAQIEAAAAPALAKAGFKPAPAHAADVLVQVGAAVRTRASPYADYGPRFGWGVGSWGWRSGWGFGMSYEPPWTELQTSVLIRDRRTHAVLYETHARYETAGGVGGLSPLLFEAALKDFPTPAASPRVVPVTLPPR